MCRRRSYRWFSFLLLFSSVVLSFSAVSVYAQMGRNTSGTGGRHTIQGSIFFPDDVRPSDGTITVKLESTSYSSLSVVTDRNGGFSFSNLTPGSYTVIIDAGENFEIAREPVYIDDTSNPPIRTDPNSPAMILPENPRTVRVPIYLQLKKNAPLNNKILNAKLAGVPKDALKHYEKGIELGQINKAEESVAELRQAVAIYPQFSVALAELGKQYLRLGKLDEAVNALRSSVNIDPKYFIAKLDYGIALLNKREIDNAETQLKDATEINPSAVTPHYYLGIVFVQKQNLEEAQNELELGAKLSDGKSYPQINKMLSRIYFELSEVYWEKKQYKLAADELEKYLQLSPNAKDAEKIRQVIKDLRSRK
ncbi:MAG: tetratricopeptide repeat protein [Acidobacteriota bacterium]|nr:tetratricopeptide repeat protein [Acidobacteriota bacterium]